MNLAPSKFKNKAATSYNPGIGMGLTSLQRDMNSLMNNFFGWNDIASPLSFSTDLYPTVDIRETDSKYFLDADVPGMSDKDLNVDIRNNVLTISGNVDTEKKKDEEGYVCVERSHQSFSRDIYLSDDIDTDSIKAELKNGVLHVELNKSEEVKKSHKKIAIKH